MIWRCDLTPQYHAYKREIDEAISRVLESGRYTLGPEVEAFEREFAQYLGIAHAVGVASGTDALILSLMALGIRPGDEVITSPFTAIPTISAIIDTGAMPVFADIDPDTWLVNLEEIAKRVTRKTKAVIPVHIFGNVVDVPRLKTLIPSHISIIEDACQSHGSTLNGIQSGTMGDVGAFSFYPTKNVGAYGDGGAIVTRDQAVAEKLRFLRMYGMTDKDHTVMHGVNSRLDELQAAILRVKLRHLDEMNVKRDAVATRYHEGLRANLFQHQAIPSNVVSNYHLFTTRLLAGPRDAFIAYLDDHDIQSNIYYPLPQHLQKAYEFLGHKKRDFPVAEAVCEQVITLPLYPELPAETQLKVIDIINAYGR